MQALRTPYLSMHHKCSCRTSHLRCKMWAGWIMSSINISRIDWRQLPEKKETMVYGEELSLLGPSYELTGVSPDRWDWAIGLAMKIVAKETEQHIVGAHHKIVFCTQPGDVAGFARWTYKKTDTRTWKMLWIRDMPMYCWHIILCCNSCSDGSPAPQYTLWVAFATWRSFRFLAAHDYSQYTWSKQVSSFRFVKCLNWMWLRRKPFHSQWNKDLYYSHTLRISIIVLRF